jgi:hypothetical protein
MFADFYGKPRVICARRRLGDLRRRRMKMFINQRVITYAAIGLRDVETFQGLCTAAAAETQLARHTELTAASSGRVN